MIGEDVLKVARQKRDEIRDSIQGSDFAPGHGVSVRTQAQVLKELYNHVNIETLVVTGMYEAWPGVERLGTRLAIEGRTVRKALRILEAERWIAPVGARSIGGPSNTTRWLLGVDRLPASYLRGNPANPDQRTANPDQRTGLDDDANPDQRTGLDDANPDQRTANPDQRTANPDQRTGEPLNPQNQSSGGRGGAADAAGADAPASAVIDNFMARIEGRLGLPVARTTKLVAAIAAKAGWGAVELADAATHRKFDLDSIGDLPAFLAARIRALPADPSAVVAKTSVADRAQLRNLELEKIWNTCWQLKNCENKHDCGAYRHAVADPGVSALLDKCDETFYEEFDPDESDSWPATPRITDVERRRIFALLSSTEEQCEKFDDGVRLAAHEDMMRAIAMSAENAVNEPSEPANGPATSTAAGSTIWA